MYVNVSLIIVYLFLPQCRVLQDVGHHGTQVRSFKRQLQQLRRGHLSSENLCHTVNKLHSRSSSASPSLHSDIFQLLESHLMSEETQLSFSYHFHQLPLCSSALKNHLITHSVRPWYLDHPSKKPHFCCLNFRLHIFCCSPSISCVNFNAVIIT